MNGLPAHSYQEVSSQYWNLIYKQPQKITVDQGVETQSNNTYDEDGKKTLHNSFNKAQSLNIAGIDNEFATGTRNFQFDFDFSSKAPSMMISQNLNQFSAFGP